MANRMATVLRVINERVEDPETKSTKTVMKLEIDGEEFPYFTVDGYHVDVRRDHLAGVTLTIAAERVEVIDAMFVTVDPAPAASMAGT